MTDRPIIFSGPMVRALLEGRKTQTRRLVTSEVPAEPAIDDVHLKDIIRHPAPYLDAYCGSPRTAANPRGMTDRWCWWTRDDRCGVTFKVPFVPGDRLWVRETCRAEEMESGQDGVRYAADEVFAPIQDTRLAADMWLALRGYRQKSCRRVSIGLPVPSIHMPRWASRITLIVTEVRVERLQDISEADARAEGMTADDDPFWAPSSADPDSGGSPSPRNSFQFVWGEIHGPDAWDANPWIAAITFDVHRQNIDALPPVVMAPNASHAAPGGRA